MVRVALTLGLCRVSVWVWGWSVTVCLRLAVSFGVVVNSNVL